MSSSGRGEARGSGSFGSGGGTLPKCNRPSVSAGWDRQKRGQEFSPVSPSKLTDWDVKAFNASRVTERTNVEELDWPVEPAEGFDAVFGTLREASRAE